MSKDFGEGIFSMEFITVVSKTRDLTMAKNVANAVINDSTARDTNKEKARAMVLKSSSVNALVINMSNFSLSHQGLRTIR